MSVLDKWYLLCYDIRDDKRYRRAIKVIKGYGERLQYSVFRCRLSQASLEKVRLELFQVLAVEDNILIIELCSRCVDRISKTNDETDWLPDPSRFQIID
jgi:CRISPR-associated protein Cas2